MPPPAPLTLPMLGRFRAWLEGPADGVALMFHSVRPDDAPAQAWRPSVTQSQFEAVIRWVVEAFEPIRARELISPGQRGGGPFVAITFDDGYRDNLTLALPVLERYGAPATVFLATGFVARDVAPCDGVLFEALADRDHLRVTWRGETLDRHAPDADAKARAYEELRLRAKAATPAERVELVKTLDPDGVLTARAAGWFLDQDEARELAASPLIDIGAHTHSHPDLSAMDDQTTRQEVLAGVERVEAMVGKRPELLAYPYGSPSEAAFEAVREAGLLAAFTTWPQGIHRGKVDRLRVPRVEIRDDAVVGARSVASLIASAVA